MAISEPTAALQWRYLHDAGFHQLVDRFVEGIDGGLATAQDLRDAVTVAEFVAAMRRLKRAGEGQDHAQGQGGTHGGGKPEPGGPGV